MKRGEVRWYKFKHPDKKRPVVILTRTSILEYLGEVTVAPVTSTIRDIPSEALLSCLDGMQNDCAVNRDHTRDGLEIKHWIIDHDFIKREARRNL